MSRESPVMMSTTNIKDLFDEARCPDGWKFVPLLVYFPFGVMLATIRLFISLQMLLAASAFQNVAIVKKFILKMMCNILGVIIREDFTELRFKTQAAPILVTNQATPVDPLVFHVATGCTTVPNPEAPAALNWLIGAHNINISQGFQQLTRILQECPSKQTSILLQPEGATTNGKVGLLKFQEGYLEGVKKVQPVAIQIWRPPTASVSPCVIGSPWWMEMLWILFVPCTVFCLRYLPAIVKSEKESTEEFTKRVQGVIATRLGVQATNFTLGDKKELEKRLVITPVRQQEHRVAQRNAELQRMVAQVREVLPYVPADVVRKDLFRTKSVDITISNILEGHISFVPVLPSTPVKSPTAVAQKPADQPSSSSTSSVAPPTTACGGESNTLNTAASTFPKSAEERSMSFKERKTRLVENARRRYIEKHGLKEFGFSAS
ncbi:lipid droplet-regulating VLDL assembly factor AUP1-like [Neocloeon triangulifer]|uniref:lipid droplet-regulating VLDL assembly factor AUP1-like n=1 Tax=Neocloeon triangulifer TaxID=2078957 RepID=UPI00286F9937|nr:lipid droplet-regulating VLDL assembly factor AUP1-like [Neocloeon triangulifer]